VLCCLVQDTDLPKQGNFVSANLRGTVWGPAPTRNETSVEHFAQTNIPQFRTARITVSSGNPIHFSQILHLSYNHSLDHVPSGYQTTSTPEAYTEHC